MQSVHVSHNVLKLLSGTFFHIQLESAGEIRKGGRYRCAVNGYGIAGEVEALSVFSCPLYDLRDTVMLMADGDTQTRDRIKTVTTFNADKVQCVIFRFVRRSSMVFAKLLDAEVPKAGISIPKQPNLFS